MRNQTYADTRVMSIIIRIRGSNDLVTVLNLKYESRDLERNNMLYSLDKNGDFNLNTFDG